jgi:regulator of RNase E activity RraA
MFQRIDDDILKGLREVTTGAVGHFMNEGFLSWEIQPIYRPIKLVGQAVTVSSPPTDNSIFLKAIEQASEGDVLVIDRRNDLRHASWGGILSLAAKQRGIAGVVIDGAATDWKEIVELQFPVYCRHLSALTTRKQNLGGTINQSVPCGGVTVHSGDVVLGDEDGVVIIPQASAEEVLRLGLEKEAQEKHMREALSQGQSLLQARSGS